jgi:hypothetical protein
MSTTELEISVYIFYKLAKLLNERNDLINVINDVIGKQKMHPDEFIEILNIESKN